MRPKTVARAVILQIEEWMFTMVGLKYPVKHFLLLA